MAKVLNVNQSGRPRRRMSCLMAFFPFHVSDIKSVEMLRTWYEWSILSSFQQFFILHTKASTISSLVQSQDLTKVRFLYPFVFVKLMTHASKSIVIYSTNFPMEENNLDWQILNAPTFYWFSYPSANNTFFGL